MSRITRPSSAGAAANRSIAASASATSLSAPRSSSVSTRTPVAGMPHTSSCPSRNRWSTAARISGMASSRSPRRALSRAKYTLTIGNIAQEVSPAQEHVADLGQELLSAVTLGSRVAVHQRKAQRHPGEGHREVIAGSFGNP